jgi:UDP-glucuronate 4-epimerase
LAKSKILLTGTAGFIGSHTAFRLLEKGFQVTGLDVINDYYEVTLKHARLKRLGIDAVGLEYGQMVKGIEDLSFIKLDLSDAEGIRELFEKEKFDYVINLAAQAGVRYSLEYPEAYVNSNITGFLNILEGCRHNQVKHLVYASTSSVYGLNTNNPFKEEEATEHPVSFYAATKKANEMMAHSYSHLYGMPTTGLRFFTVYGPWGRPDMALFKFTKNILAGKPIDVYNNGDMQRDFTYVDDIVEGISRVVSEVPEGKEQVQGNYPTNQSSAPYTIFNIGNGKPVNLMDYVTELERVLDKQAEINFMPMQAGDVQKTYASTENLLKAVDYLPQVGIEQGIREFVEWYLDYYQ